MDQEQCYFALDLELNNAQDNSTLDPKIIQIGIAVGNYHDYANQSLSSYKWFIDPQESVFEFITQLTGISNQNISDFAVPYEQVAKAIGEIISARNCFVNPITWGGGDSLELKSEFKDRGISFPYFGRRWIDVKTWHSLHMLAIGKKPSGGLSSGLGSFKLHFEGAPHRADDDALNTLRLFFEILGRQKQLYRLIDDAKTIV